ncbi:MAG: T9SS type A sorting domain-containing protein, partial [Bacteroidota bacterium]
INKVAFVINYANNTWDNNGGQDYHIDFGTLDTSTQQSFVMDGVLDAVATKAASINNLDLFLAASGSNLYVATQSATSQSGDMFIFISDSIRPLVTAPWAKSGKVTGWNYFLANESSNNWSGWFDKNGAGISLQNKSGTTLEGYFSPQSLFGKSALKLYIAIAKYQTADAGALLSQLPANNGDGNIDAAEWFTYDYGVTKVQNVNIIPDHFALQQNYPNPFNPSTTISFSIANVGTDDNPSRNMNTTITIFDLIGREVATIVNDHFSPGTYSVIWDAKNVPSGMYFYRLQSGDFTAVRRMILLK